MSEPFRIPAGGGATGVADVASAERLFARHGYAENPFPAAGLDWGVLYVEHMGAEVRSLNEWLDRVRQAVETRAPLPPLALEGALGVGKTHLLRYLELNLERRGEGTVLRKALTEHGMTRLFLSNLLLAGLPEPASRQWKGDPSPIAIIDETVDRLRNDPQSQDALEELGESPLRAPLQCLVRPADEKITSAGHIWLARWLSRAPTTQSQRARLNLKGVLDAEGEAIRAVADLLRLARRYALIRCWFVMIDQLEELWRPGVITFGRRARFLTDLRLLIDQALEGAPLAVVIAWNTRVGFFGPDPGNSLKDEYAALARRLGTPVPIPALQGKDVVPFAENYVSEAEKRVGLPGKSQERGDFARSLFGDKGKAVLDAVAADQQAVLGADRYAAAFVLEQWRVRAQHVATGG